MLIIKGDQVVNLDQTFSIYHGGASGRALIFRGSDVLSAELIFRDRNEAIVARQKIIDYANHDRSLCDLDDMKEYNE